MASSGVQTGNEDGQVSALKRKTEKAKKSELIREIHKLEIQIQAFEKERLTHIFNKRSDFRKEFADLEDEDMKMTDERKTEKVKLKQQLGKMSQMVKRFQRELRDIKPTPEFVEKLKTVMEEIETTINAFKEQQRLKYDDLLRSERGIFQELQLLDHKFEAWSQVQNSEPIASGNSEQPVASVRDVNRDLPPEVAAFNKFVYQSGGHYGGWDEHDHQIFLRYRNMYKGRIVFLDHVKPLLPIRSENEIREHETWYQEYTFLLENKKCVIKKWRDKKEEEKEDAIMHVQGDLEQNLEKDTQAKKLSEATAQEKAERCKRINAWKVQKELEKAIREERKLKEEQEKKKKQTEERKNQLEVKKKVDEIKKQRNFEEEMLAMIEEERRNAEAEIRRQTSAREIGKFRSRDIRRLNDKLEKEKEKEYQQKEKERRLELLKDQVHVEAARDPSRLLQPTAGWKARLKDSGPSGGGQVLNMPHRAVPGWRQGMH